jgi:ribonuclease P protein component
MAVSRRIGGAVVRNRVKRRVRESFRTILRPMLTPGSDLVVIARSGAGELAFSALQDELVQALSQLERRVRSPATRR